VTGSSITITSLRSWRSSEKKLGGKEDVLKRADIKAGFHERSVQHCYGVSKIEIPACTSCAADMHHMILRRRAMLSTLSVQIYCTLIHTS
jgi:hypothetical protein